MTFGTAPLAQWDPAYLHLATAVHVPSAAMIDAAIAGAIVDAAAEDACCPIVDWLCATLMRSGPDALSTLVVSDPSAPLPDTLLLEHRHRLLLGHLPGLDPSINLAAGTRIAETVGEVAVELRETRLEKKRVREGKER